MMKLTLDDLTLALEDLLKKHPNLLRQSALGSFYETILREKLEAVRGLLRREGRSLPMTVELKSGDQRHDGFGRALFFFTEAYKCAPSVSPELKAKAQQIQDLYIPALGELRRSYADEATKAKKRRPKLERDRDLPSLFPLADNGTLYDWLDGFIGAGEQLDGLLSERAKEVARESTEAAALRSEIIGILGNFRRSLSDEIEANPKLPRNLDALLFGYFDELQRLRETQSAGKQATATEAQGSGGTPAADEDVEPSEAP